MQKKWKQSKVPPANRLRDVTDALRKVKAALETAQAQAEADLDLAERGLAVAQARAADG